MFKFQRILFFIISFFGIGLISKRMPGTIASIFGMLFLFLLPSGFFLTVAIAIFIFVLGWKCCDLYIIKYGYETNRDPGYAVIDEVCGIFVGASIIYSFGLVSPFAILCNFLLFRFFDILKPFPIRNFEKIMKHREQTVGIGIMFDDVLAGIFAAVFQIAIYYACF